MKIQNLIVTLLINTCVSSLLLNTAINQSANAQTADQIRKMSAAGAPIILPSYVPSGFQLTKFTIAVEPLRPNHIHNNVYSATFKGPNNCQFSVSGESYPQWGAPGPVRQWTFNTTLFGQVILEEWDGTEFTPPVPNYLSSQVPADPRLGSGLPKDFPHAGYDFDFRCKYSVFNYQQASRIMKSVRIVK
jgi:hypothetical protein